MIRIGKYKISMKFVIILAIVLFLIYLKWKAGTETIGPGNVLEIFGLK